MKKKQIKNPESPLGRNDFIGRSPRWRLSLTQSQLLILKEWAEEYFTKYPGKRIDQVYSDLYERIGLSLDSIQTPLLTEVSDNSLF